MLTNTAWHIILMFWLCCSFSIYTIWPIFYPYYASYVRGLNENVTMKFIYSMVLFQYLGYSTASFYTNLMLYYLGLRKAVLVVGVLGMSVSLAATFFSDPVVLIAVFYFVGVIQQSISILTILFFIERHKRVAAAFYSKSLAGQLVGAFIWTEVLSYMLNPQDTRMGGEGGLGYYDKRAVASLEQFLKLQAVAAILVALFVYYHLPESRLYRGVLLRRKSMEREDDTYKSFQQTLHSSITYFSLQDPKANEILSKLAQNNEGDISEHGDSEELYKSFLFQNLDASSYFNDETSACTELQEYTRGVKIEVIETIQVSCDKKPSTLAKDVFTIKFVLLFATSVVRNSETAFMIDNIKVQGSFLPLGDKSLDQAFALSVLLALLLKGHFYKIWEAFGIIDCYCIVIISNLTFAYLSLDLINRLPSVFYLAIIYMRAVAAFNIFINSMTLYTTYKQTKAMRLSQTFELHRITAILLAIGVNFVFVDDEGLESAYTFYLLASSIGLCVLILCLRAIISRERIRKMFY